MEVLFLIRVKRDFWKYISLGIFGMLGSAGTILADAFFVSDRLGAAGLAAMNIAMCVFGLMNGTGLLFGIGGATRYTIASAQGDTPRANQVFVLSFFTALLLGTVFALTGVFFSVPISYLLGADNQTISMCNSYLKTILCFAPAFVLNHLLMAFVRNDGNPALSTCAMMTGSIANIVLDYLFMYPLGMGIFGAAIATGFAALIGIGISCMHFLSGKNSLHFVGLQFRLREIGAIAALGISAFITEFSSSVVLVVYNLLVLGKAGNTGVAAYGIVANLALTVLAVMNGISHGLQPLFSKMYGMGKASIAKKLYRRGVLLAFFLGTAVLAAAIAFTPTLVGWFNGQGDAALQVLAERGLRLYFVGFLFVGHNYLSAAYFSATEMPRQAFTIAFFRGLVGIVSMVCLLSFYFGMRGIWLAFPAVEAITVGLCLFLHGKVGIALAPVRPMEECSLEQ